MPSVAVDTTDAVQVLTAQMDDMQNDSTRVAYQLASPSNRAFTARSSNPDLNGYNEERFDSMVRGSTYSPLLSGIKPNYFKKQCFFVIIFLPKVIIEVQSGNRVLNRLVPCIKCMELAC